MSTSQFAIATHALAVLAHDGGGAPIDVLAEGVNTARSFLHSVMTGLQRAGLVEARDGGGYHLTRPAGSITLQQVHDALDLEGPSSAIGGRATMRTTLEAVIAQAAQGAPDLRTGLASFTVQDVARMAFGERAVPYLDAHSFQGRVLEAKRPVLVEFTASWCSPCKALAPILDDLASKSAGKFDVVKVDIDDAPEIAQRFTIRGVPTVIAFVGGKPVAQHVGVANAATLLKLLPA